MSAKWDIQIMRIIGQLRLILMNMGHRLMTYTTQLIPKIISNILHCESPYMLKFESYGLTKLDPHMSSRSPKRSNTHPCTSKALHTIGIYGGKEEFSHIIGILSKMIFFKDSRASQKNIFFPNSPNYNKKAA